MKPGEEIRTAQHETELEISKLLAHFNVSTGVQIDSIKVEYLTEPNGKSYQGNRPVVVLHVET